MMGMKLVVGAALARVLNTLWVGLAIAAVAWALGRYLPRTNAATRHLLGWAALVLVLANHIGDLEVLREAIELAKRRLVDASQQQQQQ